MSAAIIFIIVVAVITLLGLILAEMPIWVALAGSGTLGLLLLSGSNVAWSTLAQVPYGSTANYALVVIPMFVLMGVFAHRAGLAKDLFAVAQRLTYRLPGGLGVATILACGGFSAVTGSSVATVATIGRISVDQMVSRGYRANAAAALVALGATLGVLIPPSILMVVFGILTGESIGRLLMAGIIPGLVTMFFYMASVVVLYKRGYFAPKTDKELAVQRMYEAELSNRLDVMEGKEIAAGSTAVKTKVKTGRVTDKLADLPKVTRKNIAGGLYTALLFTVVIGGMYSGLFTSTEAGAVAAVASLIILLLRTFREGVKGVFNSVKESLIESASVSTMIFALLFGGAIFAFFLLKSGVPNAIAKSVIAANLPPLVVIVISLVMLIILGAFLDELSILLIVIPLLWPVIDQMGVDGIWYGILVMKATSIGMIAPPVGLNVFVASGTSKHASADGIYKAILPFFIVEILVIATLIIFPNLSTFLPNLMFG